MPASRQSESSDSEHPDREQYGDSRRLLARILFHQRFSTTKYEWYLWVFDHFHLADSARVLKLGCGTGGLWARNTDRIPPEWDITLSDLSVGMVREARQALGDSGRQFAHVVTDAQAIPFPDQSLDCVIANHMLYYVPDRAKALSEMHRVLRCGGRLFATTNGRGHLRELWEMAQKCGIGSGWDADSAGLFGVENAPAELSHWFAEVELHRYDDALLVTEAEPFIAYVVSTMSDASSACSGSQLAALRALVEDQLARDGSIRITKDSALFEARREDGD